MGGSTAKIRTGETIKSYLRHGVRLRSKNTCCRCCRRSRCRYCSTYSSSSSTRSSTSTLILLNENLDIYNDDGCAPVQHEQQQQEQPLIKTNYNSCDLCNNNNCTPRCRSKCKNNYYYFNHKLLLISLYLLLTDTCLYFNYFVSIVMSKLNDLQIRKLLVIVVIACATNGAFAFSNDFDKSEPFLDKINLEQSIAAVFNKVAYGSTTKRSIPDNAYPVTTLATPLLTTYRYSDGSNEWLSVDVKKPDLGRNYDLEQDENRDRDFGYGADLEKDHALPTSAPAADILKNNNNKNYDNPNRYNNDRLKDYENRQDVTESYKTTTSYNVLRNVRPTKSIYSKDIPSYVPPSRAFFTPPLPPEYLSPFADKPTLRGTNSDGFVNKRPFPPPSLMPNKDRIPFLPPSKVNVERERVPINEIKNDTQSENKKKSLNTPSQNANLDRLGQVYGLNRNVNESNFEYEKDYLPSITRILSGSNGRHDDISDILLRTVTATPNVQKPEHKVTKTRAPSSEKPPENAPEPPEKPSVTYEDLPSKKEIVAAIPEKELKEENKEVTTQIADFVNLPNRKERNVTKADSDEIWVICWNVHVYLVVVCYVILAACSIYKLIRYENDPHMFSKSYFLTIHLMLTVICVLRIFYLTYDPYNVYKSFNIFLYDFLHNFPLSLLATTFAVLILFLLKRTLTHLKVKTRPVFLVLFGVMHIFLCFCLSISETLGHFERASLIVCKPVFVLLAWALGVSYLYLYKIIKNVLAKKSQNLSEMCTQNISYASHITIAVALLFVLLGFVQLYALFFIKIDRFNVGEIKHHWILWGFELSVRLLEISIITLLAIVVSLKMSQREKQTVGFPLFPCTTSDSSTDNIYPNNCNTNPNALNYSRNEMILDNLPAEPERPNLLKNAFQNDSFDKKSTLERYHSDGERSNNSNFERFERPNWSNSERFEQTSLNAVPQQHFERSQQNNSSTSRNSARKTYESAKYYAKYDVELEDYQQEHNVYSEPVDQSSMNHQYERTRHEFERGEFDRRSRNSSNTSGRRSTGRARKNHARPHLGVQTLPNHDARHNQVPDSVLVEDQGFLRFKMQEFDNDNLPKRNKKQDVSHYSDA